MVALTSWNLLEANSEAHDQALRNAHDQAVDLAQRTADALRRPDWLASLPATARFELRERRLIIPLAVEMLEDPTVAAADPLDLALDDKLDAAARAEFVHADIKAAAAAYDQVLASPVLSDRRRPRVLLAAAWQAERSDDSDRAMTLLGRIEGEVCDTDAIESATLLSLALGSGVPDFAKGALGRMPPVRATPLLARMRDYGVETATIADTVEHTHRWRQTLRAVNAHVEFLADAPGIVVQELGTRLLVYHPTESGTGHGALLDAEDGIQSLLARGLRQGADFVTAPFATEVGQGLHVVPGLIATQPRPLAAASTLTQPWLTAIALVFLVLTFLLTMFSAMRSVRRESDALRTRAEFMTMVTHELKTPLASIRLFAEMLEDGRAKVDDHEDYYSLLSSEAGRLTLLIENVLDLGRIERGERSYDQRRHDLDLLVEEATDILGPIAKRDGMTIQRELAAACQVDVDRGALMQTLLNVLDNARKYASGTLEVETHADSALATVTIRDHGPGIPSEEQGSIFDRFERGARQRDGKVPGVGLGLYLARTIARVHGGDLTCTSASGSGAEFTLTLPILKETDDAV